ncbi:hypothetical protein ACKWMY_06795 [Serratia sp. J2]|uniref:hypothetical protein n=1 Tax=Serratia sp. J2 TaxID=3386551 RepID=UPI0039175D97
MKKTLLSSMLITLFTVTLVNAKTIDYTLNERAMLFGFAGKNYTYELTTDEAAHIDEIRATLTRLDKAKKEQEEELHSKVSELSRKKYELYQNMRTLEDEKEVILHRHRAPMELTPSPSSESSVSSGEVVDMKSEADVGVIDNKINEVKALINANEHASSLLESDDDNTNETRPQKVYDKKVHDILKEISDIEKNAMTRDLHFRLERDVGIKKDNEYIVPIFPCAFGWGQCFSSSHKIYVITDVVMIPGQNRHAAVYTLRGDGELEDYYHDTKNSTYTLSGNALSDSMNAYAQSTKIYVSGMNGTPVIFMDKDKR